jgi:hypothetical protein
MNDQSNPVVSRGSTNPRPRRNRPNKNQNIQVSDRLRGLEDSIKALHDQYKFKTVNQAINSYKANGRFAQRINQDYRQFGGTKGFNRYVDRAVANKIVENLAGNDPYLNRHIPELKLAIMADDPGAILSVLKTVGSYLPYAKEAVNRLKQLHKIWTKPGASIMDKIGSSFSLSDVPSDATISYEPVEQLPVVNSVPVMPSQGPNTAAYGSYASRPIAPLMSLKVTMNSVSKAYIASVICPAKYSALLPTSLPTNAAIAAGTVTFNVVTNASGAAGVYINPRQLIAPGTATGTVAVSAGAFSVHYNNATFSLSTGIQPAADLRPNTPGPLNAQAANIQIYTLTAGAVEVTPTTNLNNSQGYYELIYLKEPYNSTFLNANSNNGMALPVADMEQLPFYQKSNMLGTTRVIVVPDDNNAMVTTYSTETWKEGMYIAITGSAASTQVLSIKVSFVANYIPVSSMAAMIPVLQCPANSYASRMCLSALIFQHPYLAMATSAQAEKFADRLMNVSTDDCDQVVQAMSDYQWGSKDKYTPVQCQSAPLDLSLDMIV